MGDINEKGMVNLEVLAIGLPFRELGYRWLEDDLKKPPFQKRAPLFTRLHG
ncbi:MAG: hypothetical protein V1861_02500 [Candidatus Micrarchaeota archaeon]